MSIYDVDFNQFAETQSPPDKRTPKSLAFLRALFGEIADDYNLIFGQYKLGSTDPAYVAGTYARRAMVIFNGGVYQSKVDGNTTDPTNTTNWRKISDTFIGVDERVSYRSEKLVMEWALNSWFGTAFRQPAVGTPDIYISTNALLAPVFVIGAIEDESSDVFDDTSSEFVINSYTFEAQYDFTIYIPTAVYAALGSAAESKVRNFADKYVAAGILYNIATY